MGTDLGSFVSNWKIFCVSVRHIIILEFNTTVLNWMFTVDSYVDSGRLFTCGDGSFGQLGLGDFSSHCYPVEVSCFASKHVGQIACGMRHSLVLLKGT